MSYNVKPGDRAIIIDSVNGLTGPSVGRKVMVYANAPERGAFDDKYVDASNSLNDPWHYCPPSPYEKEHTQLGKIWPVQSLDGRPFVNNESGSIATWADVPDKFLQKLPDEEQSGALVREAELVIVR